MDGLAGERLVGRIDALARVARSVDGARHGRGSALLVSGAAGIGKTTLLRAAVADADDVDLTWGTCVESGSAPGFWPWTQALNGLVRVVGPERARAAAGGDLALLATLAPALGNPGSAEESDRGRMLLLDATVAWLHALGATRPVVVVLDDLHWADESSLALLELVAQDPRPASVAVLGAFRHDEVPRSLRTRVTAVVARAEHVHLTGLDRRSAGQFVELVAGRRLPDDTAEEICRRADGHPFFMRELALAASAGQPDDRIPVAVQEAVERRLRAFSPPAQEVLRVAAVTGAALLPDVVAAVAGLTQAEVEAAAAEAAAAGMVLAEGGRLRFAHDLFRETIVAGIDAAARPHLHLAVAAALEARAERGGEVTPSEIARHFRAAVPVGAVDRAVTWALRAANADRSALALSEAAAHLRRLRAAVTDAGLHLSDVQQVDVLLAEADVLARAGRPSDARGLVRAARAAADRAGDAGRMTRAALGAAALGSRFAMRRDDVVTELESALVAVGDGEPALQARLMAALARELQHSVAEQRARAAPLTEQALELGRSTHDPAVLTACLLARHDLLWTPGKADMRAAVAAELVDLAERAGDPERHAEALLLLANAFLESGSAAFEPALNASLELLTGLGQPRHLYTVETRQACLGLLRGRLDEAESRIDSAVAVGERLREPDTGNVRMSQRLELVRARGRPEELIAFAGDAVAHWTGAPIHAHAVAAGFCARAGDLDGARHHVAVVYDLGSWRADRSYLWSVFVRELAVAAAAIEDRALCAALLDELRQFGSSCGVNGAVVAFAGCHAHTAGRLAAALGHRDLATSLLEDACAVYERLGAAMLAEARGDLAACARQAVVAAGALRHRGSVWEVEYAGRAVSVPHCKGLRDIAHLLQRPGSDVHVLDLMQSGARSEPAGDRLDRRAVDSYRQRLLALSDERIAAERDGDLARLRALDEEHDALAAELGGGTGLGGRARRFANHPAERARKAVTARIRDAVRRLEQELPELAAHLDAELVTGVECRYRGHEQWDVVV